RIDLVHLTTPGPIGLAALFVARRLRLPLVGSFHTDLAAYATLLSGWPWPPAWHPASNHHRWCRAAAGDAPRVASGRGLHRRLATRACRRGLCLRRLLRVSERDRHRRQRRTRSTGERIAGRCLGWGRAAWKHRD